MRKIVITETNRYELTDNGWMELSPTFRQMVKKFIKQERAKRKKKNMPEGVKVNIFEHIHTYGQLD